MPTNLNDSNKDPETGYLTPKARENEIVFGSESKKRFLEQMELSGNLAQTCDIVGIGMTTYYAHLKNDEAFARDVAITLKRMASKLEGVMFKNAHAPQGYMDRVTWLRRWFPKEWTPKTQIEVQPKTEDIDTLFDALRAEGSLIDVENEQK